MSDIPDLAADLGEEPTTQEQSLPSLETLLDAFPAPDAETFDSMISVAVDPATEDPGTDLIPDGEPEPEPDPELDEPWDLDLVADPDPDLDDPELDPAPSDDDPLAGWE